MGGPHLTDEQIRIVLNDMVNTNELLMQALPKHNISVSGFLSYVRRSPQLTEEYQITRRTIGENLAAEAKVIADTETDPNRARNRIQIRQWLASKLCPQEYGDRIDVNVNQTVSLTAALEAARLRSGLATIEVSSQQYPSKTYDTRAPEILKLTNVKNDEITDLQPIENTRSIDQSATGLEPVESPENGSTAENELDLLLA